MLIISCFLIRVNSQFLLQVSILAISSAVCSFSAVSPHFLQELHLRSTMTGCSSSVLHNIRTSLEILPPRYSICVLFIIKDVDMDVTISSAAIYAAHSAAMPMPLERFPELTTVTFLKALARNGIPITFTGMFRHGMQKAAGNGHSKPQPLPHNGCCPPEKMNPLSQNTPIHCHMVRHIDIIRFHVYLIRSSIICLHTLRAQ